MPTCSHVGSGNGTLVYRILSAKLCVGIGLISYSAYLWHQPILAFAKMRGVVGEVSSFTSYILIVLTFVLAYFSWKFIEIPFRNKDKIGRRKIVTLMSIIGIAYIFIGLIGTRWNGLDFRYNDEQRYLMSFLNYPREEIYSEGMCFFVSKQGFKGFDQECFSQNEEVFLWGDSYAAALSYGLRKRFPDLTQLTSSGCLPLLEARISWNPLCESINDYVFEKVQKRKPSKILLHANWVRYDENIIIDHLSETLLRIRSVSPNSKIVVIGNVPRWKPSLPQILIRNIPQDETMAYLHNTELVNIMPMENKLMLISNKEEALFISPSNILCKDSKCLTAIFNNGLLVPTTWDDGHLTAEGSMQLAERLFE
ncbi:hypothetical protein AB835_12790 [Candidatus Endobugula sertula]|uniref:SGNH domain-containing protein n=1 Tax=Candidatus Endobugula sertula TaxID=62101 RepID=A0A1D2QMA4_9GAMM|nr:hypothetical protein AB835_12790 [Candidatus Endobugula sertula]